MREKSCELYGYDFMIDDDCNPMLIEVNSSPAMDYSTDITKSLFRRCYRLYQGLTGPGEVGDKEAFETPGPKARAQNNTGL